MSQSAHLEVVVTSSGVVSADKDLKQLTATAKETEKQQQHMAAVFAEVAAAEERESAKAIAAADKRAAAQVNAAAKASAAAEQQAAKAASRLARENEQWNDHLQRALARDEKRVESARKAAERIASVGGLDGVLPKRPSLGRIEEGLNGAKDGAMSSLGIGVIAGGVAGIAAAGVEKLFSVISDGKDKVIETAIEMDNLKARIAGVTGGADSANEKFEELESMTLGKLPSTVREVSEAFVFLGNTGLNNSREALKSYSNIAAQTGHSLGDVAHSVELAAQGNYRSLREYGIKVKEEGDNLQVTFRGQTETISHGAEAMEAYMQRLGNVEFAGAVDRQMDTIGGAVKRTHDAWEKLIETVAESSLGSLIASTVGAGVGAIDMMTSSVDALFDKVHKGAREIEADRARLAEQDKLDKTMSGWADPSASRSEIAQLAARLEAHGQSNADKALAQYAKNEALIAKLETLGESSVGDMTLEQARAENERQYRRDNGGDKHKTASTSKQLGVKDTFSYDDIAYMGKRDTNAAFLKEADDYEAAQAKEYAALKITLAKKEDAERVFYEHNKDLILKYGTEGDAEFTENENAWILHLAKLSDLKVQAALQDAQKEQEFQKRIRPFGEKPQSQFMAINTKFEGQQIDLRNAFGDRLQEDPSNPFADETKLAQQAKYKEKSLAIERERVKEIAAANKQLVLQSTQNADAMFGNLAEAAKNWGGTQSEAYKDLFAMQKAFGVATATVSMGIAIGKAAELGWPEGIPAAIEAAADGAKVLAMISSANYAGAHDLGGDIPAGSFGLVGERGPELVNGPAHVTSRAETARMLAGGGQSQAAQPNITIHNFPDYDEAFHRYMSSTRGTQLFVNHIKQNARTIRAVAR
jgi:hypothetical protein